VNNVMLDLETLGTQPGSVVLSIGAVAFNEDDFAGGISASFYTVISVEDSLRLGLTIDASTLRWWANQSRTTYLEALGGSTGLAAPVPVGAALLALNSWLEFNTGGENVRMWGNGADFDLTLLLACYRKTGLAAPWKFYNHRCYRTLKNLYPSIPLERANNHNALDDARNQAEHAVAILRAMR
jgi:hypothetical protein